MERVAQLTFPIWGLEGDATGERGAGARVSGEDPGRSTASYQLASQGLRSHLKG